MGLIKHQTHIIEIYKYFVEWLFEGVYLQVEHSLNGKLLSDCSFLNMPTNLWWSTNQTNKLWHHKIGLYCNCACADCSGLELITPAINALSDYTETL